MRLRYLAVDYFAEAASSASEEWQRLSLPIPELECPENFDSGASAKSLGEVHRKLFDGNFFRSSVELHLNCLLPGNMLSVCEKFFKATFPSRLEMPTANPGMVGDSLAELEEIESVCSGQISLNLQQKDQLKYPANCKFVEIEPPSPGLAVLWKFLPENASLSNSWHKIIAKFGLPAVRTVATGQDKLLFNVEVLQLWSDISPLRYSPDHHACTSSAIEDRPTDIENLHRILEACVVQQSLETMVSCKIVPLEVPLIREERKLHPTKDEAMTYPISPPHLLQQLQPQQRHVDEETVSLLSNDLTSYGQLNLAEKLTARRPYDGLNSQAISLSNLCNDDRNPDLCCPFFTEQSGSGPLSMPLDLGFAYELPAPNDWRISLSKTLNPALIAADMLPRPAPDLPLQHLSDGFQSLVIMRELRPDDHQFQYLPIPQFGPPKDDNELDVSLGRLISIDCVTITVPATNWLYLDWHYFHGMTCTNAACFSLQTYLGEDARCRSIPAVFLTTDSEVLTSRKCSELALQLFQLEDDDLHQDVCLDPSASAANGKKGASAPSLPTATDSKTRGKQTSRFRSGSQKTPENGRRDGGSHSDPNGTGISTPLKCDPAIAYHNEATTGTEKDKGTMNAGVAVGVGTTSSVKGRGPDPPGLPPAKDIRESRPATTLNCSLKDADFQAVDGNRSSDHLRNMKPQLREPDPMPMVSTRGRESQQVGFELMSSDLDFFMRARNGELTRGTSLGKMDKKRSCSHIASNAQQDFTPSPTSTMDKTVDKVPELSVTLCVHKIELSQEMRDCLASLSSNYYELLDSEAALGTKILGHQNAPIDFGVDAESNRRLDCLIRDLTLEATSPQCKTLVRVLTGLLELRCTALSLCSYGFQVAHCDLENRIDKMTFLNGYLLRSRVELKQAYEQVERGILEDHPKLAYMEKLVQPLVAERNSSRLSSKRILLLADRRAFFTLDRKMVSLGFSPHQIDREEKFIENGLLEKSSIDKLNEEIFEALTFADCLLVASEYMNPSCPVNCFSMIILYADIPEMNAACTDLLERRCEKHSFKMVLHPEDFQRKSFVNSSQRQEHRTSQAENVRGLVQSLLLNPNSDQLRSRGPTSSSKQTLFTEPHMQHRSSIDHERRQGDNHNRSSDGQTQMIIVVNICLHNDHLLTSRRSSYEKILRLEKENVQVVERELRLPIDLILTPASCLAIYTLGKLNIELQDLQYKENAMEYDVATHLKAISFAFYNCIMIFEGPNEFTSAAQQNFPKHSALAAALKIQLQCFSSQYIELTDQIVMDCIGVARSSKQKPSYPMMSEGPTIAEASLTAFPSINPLTAHAILSSGLSVPAFTSLTTAQQVALLTDWEVPQHCLDLFNIQCSYQTHGISDFQALGEQRSRSTIDNICVNRENRRDLSTEIGNVRQTPQLRKRFPEFPPASELTDNCPTYGGPSNCSGISIFPEFPSASEVSAIQDESLQDRAPCSPNVYVVRHSSTSDVSGDELLSSPLKNSDREDGFLLPQEVHGARKVTTALNAPFVANPFLWRLKNPNPEDERMHRGAAIGDIHVVQNRFRLYDEPADSRSTRSGAERSHGDVLEVDPSSWPINGSPLWAQYKSSDAAIEHFLRQPDNLWDAAEIPSVFDSTGPTEDAVSLCVRRENVGYPRTSPTIRSRGQAFGLTNAHGSWNDHKRMRGMDTKSFMNESLDLPELSNGFTSSSLSSSRSDELSTPSQEWIEAIAAAHGREDAVNRSNQSGRREETLTPSSLESFRFQSKGHVPRKTHKPAKPRYTKPIHPSKAPRTNVTARPCAVKHRGAVIKILGESSVDKRVRKTLGYAPRGSDTQQRLVWTTVPSLPSTKRRKADTPSTTAFPF